MLMTTLLLKCPSCTCIFQLHSQGRKVRLSVHFNDSIDNPDQLKTEKFATVTSADNLNNKIPVMSSQFVNFNGRHIVAVVEEVIELIFSDTILRHPTQDGTHADLSW